MQRWDVKCVQNFIGIATLGKRWEDNKIDFESMAWIHLVES
jgi:hypothetical protein